MSNGHNQAKVRESNTRLERLTLIEHWNNPVLSLMKDKSPIIDGVFEIYLTTGSINERIKKITDKTKYSYCQVSVIQVIDAVFNNTCKGVSINGLADEELYITKSDLRPIEKQADTIVTMMAVLSERLTKTDAMNRLEEREFYVLGEIPETFNKEEDLYAFDAKNVEGKNYVKLFMTEHKANMSNDRNFEVGRYSLRQIREAFRGHYGLIVEPAEEYAVCFEAEEL